MLSVLQNLRYGFRMLLKAPGFTTAVVLSLALGIGANSAIFSLINGVFFRPMSGVNTNQLVSLYTSDYSGPVYRTSSYPDYVDFRDQSNLFDGLAAYTEISPQLKMGERSEPVFSLLVTSNYFDVLGVKAALGRTFLSEEDSSLAGGPVVVISYSMWQQRFGSDPSLVGKTVTLNDKSVTVVGIAPENFVGTDFGRTPNMWLPMSVLEQIGLSRDILINRGTRIHSILGRLKPEFDVPMAQHRLDLLSSQLAKAYPAEWKNLHGMDRTVNVLSQKYVRLPPDVRSNILRLATIFMVLVGIVLLIACTNASNLLAARAVFRQKEIAIRTALGATRFGLVKQLITESLLLSLLAGVVGLISAIGFLYLLVAWYVPPSSAVVARGIGLNPTVVVLTLGLSILTGLIFGLVPALHATRRDLTLVIREEVVRYRPGRVRINLHYLFVMTQLVLSVLLLIVAGLFVRSLNKAQSVDLGYNVDNCLTFWPNGDFLKGDIAARERFYTDAVENLRRLPGIQGATLADAIPSGSGLRRVTVAVEGYHSQLGEDMEIMFGNVGLNYFSTMGMSFVGGRDFTVDDKAGAPGVVIVNETMARRFWPGISPLGKRLRVVGISKNLQEVVGVVKDAKSLVYQDEALPFFYLPMLQNSGGQMAIHVRTSRDPKMALPAIQNSLTSIDGSVTLHSVRTLAEYVDDSLLMLRVGSLLSGLFGLLALVLTSVGLYGVMAHSVARRTREIGVRMALGAQRRDIFRLILGEGLVLVAIGISIGILLAYGVTRVLGLFLFGITATDPISFVGFSVLLAVVALIACFVPAWRATKVDPLVALRVE